MGRIGRALDSLAGSACVTLVMEEWAFTGDPRNNRRVFEQNHYYDKGTTNWNCFGCQPPHGQKGVYLILTGRFDIELWDHKVPGSTHMNGRFLPNKVAHMINLWKTEKFPRFLRVAREMPNHGDMRSSWRFYAPHLSEHIVEEYPFNDDNGGARVKAELKAAGVVITDHESNRNTVRPFHIWIDRTHDLYDVKSVSVKPIFDDDELSHLPQPVDYRELHQELRNALL